MHKIAYNSFNVDQIYTKTSTLYKKGAAPLNKNKVKKFEIKGGSQEMAVMVV